MLSDTLLDMLLFTWIRKNKWLFVTLPVFISNIDDSVALAFSLIENIQRENLNPIEEALALNRFRAPSLKNI